MDNRLIHDKQLWLLEIDDKTRHMEYWLITGETEESLHKVLFYLQPLPDDWDDYDPWWNSFDEDWEEPSPSPQLCFDPSIYYDHKLRSALAQALMEALCKAK